MPPSPLLDGISALINPLLAYGSFTLFALGAVLALRDVRRVRQGQLLILVLLSQMLLALASLPDAHALPRWLVVSAQALAIPNLGFLWWFCLSLLRDEGRIGAFEWTGLVALSAIPLIYAVERLEVSLSVSDAANSIGNFPPIVMVGHVVWVAIAERNSDLVEPRRRARLWLAFAPLVALLVSLVAESMDSEQAAAIVRNGLGIIPAQCILFFWLMRMSVEQLQFRPLPTSILPMPQIDPKDVALHRRLMKAMDEDEIYLRHGLTIDGLADLLNAPAHQLRHLINAGLGWRNFAAFLNAYRLARAKRALTESDRARDTVLAIAYESGFASLPSFNRVFKQVEGQTPTEFRAAALSQPDQS